MIGNLRPKWLTAHRFPQRGWRSVSLLRCATPEPTLLPFPPRAAPRPGPARSGPGIVAKKDIADARDENAHQPSPSNGSTSSLRPSYPPESCPSRRRASSGECARCRRLSKTRLRPSRPRTRFTSSASTSAELTQSLAQQSNPVSHRRMGSVSTRRKTNCSGGL